MSGVPWHRQARFERDMPKLELGEVTADEKLWEQIKVFLGAEFLEENERSLIPQWQACIDFDVVERLPSCEVPLHVFGFAEDVQAPWPYGKRVADLAPNAEFHFFEGMGHCSIFGHTHDILNPRIKEIVGRYFGSGQPWGGGAGNAEQLRA